MRGKDLVEALGPRVTKESTGAPLLRMARKRSLRSARAQSQPLNNRALKKGRKRKLAMEQDLALWLAPGGGGLTIMPGGLRRTWRDGVPLFYATVKGCRVEPGCFVWCLCFLLNEPATEHVRPEVSFVEFRYVIFEEYQSFYILRLAVKVAGTYPALHIL